MAASIAGDQWEHDWAVYTDPPLTVNPNDTVLQVPTLLEPDSRGKLDRASFDEEYDPETLQFDIPEDFHLLMTGVSEEYQHNAGNSEAETTVSALDSHLGEIKT